ncbi:P-loop containing nucleoside triphosphate hydrolase protein [Aspergillus karnatakaensis]|uniref:putative dynamin GTPase n=1 Tax=Aspergillus karnatakaensis TaxID=1810916 RepID=UPI003CCCCC56
MRTTSLAIRSTPEVSSDGQRRDISRASAETLTPTMEAPEKPDPSSELNNLTQSMTTLVKKIRDLRHIGIEDSKISLPKICVIGDQSTGKSSLIEGMSQIKLPRSSGTCTRCPMEINLSESDPDQAWSCSVYLSRRYMFDGAKKFKPRKSDPLGPWHPQDQEDEFFITITDTDKVEKVIKCAQMAILNPSEPSDSFIPREDEEMDTQHVQVKFSPNVVRLDITAPGFPSLSFYDLPGVINQAEVDEERYLVPLVENLVKQYINQEHCIVLLTMTMTDDVMNSSASRILRDTRGATGRALGVLTKPDRIQPGDPYTQWVEILEGVKFELEHGYYVVKNNPNPSVEHSVARKEEEDFFATAPWATELAEYCDKFGTRNLQAMLSELLFQQIQRCLPSIIDKIDEKAARIDEELSTLPAPPSANIPYILCGKLHTLKDRIRSQIDGGSRDYPLQKQWNEIAEDFKLALTKTRPSVRLLTERDKSIIERDDDDSDVELVESPRKRKLPGNVTNPASPSVQGKAKKPTGYHTHHFDQFTRAAIVFTWEDIRGINRESASAGIPQQINLKAIDYMNQMSVAHWREPMITFIDASHQVVKEVLLHELKKAFLQYNQTGLFRELEKIMKGYLKRLRADHVAHVEEIYSIEHQKPFTMANSALEKATSDALKMFEESRSRARKDHYLNQRYQPEDQGREAARKKLGDAELGADEFTMEVKMMATTRGYYMVASSRFLDSVCQSVHTKLFFKCREHLVETIEQELGIQDENAAERCAELMSEDVGRQRRRLYLEKEKEKIAKAQDWLRAEKSMNDQDEMMEIDQHSMIKSQSQEW